jgi:cell shape-determining protein MreC
MKIYIIGSDEAEDVVRLLRKIEHKVDRNVQQVENVMLTVRDLVDAVNAERATEDKLVALATAQQAQLKDLSDQLAAAIAANDQTQLQATLDSLNQNRQTMDDFLAQVQGGGGNASIAGGGAKP